MKIRILAPGFENYTGYFGTIAFEDGVSEEVSGPDAQRMGSILHVEVVGTGENPSVTQVMVDTRNRNLDDIGGTPKTLAELDEEAKAAALVAKVEARAQAKKTTTAPEGSPVIDLTVLSYDYDKDTLRELVGKQGIAGLRSFSEPYGIKGRSVKDIVNDMLALKDSMKPAPVEAPAPTEPADDVLIVEGDADDGEIEMELIDEIPVPPASPVVDTIPTGEPDFVAPTEAPAVPEGTEIVEDTDDLDAELAALTDTKE